MEVSLFHTLAITALVIFFVAKIYLSHKTIQFLSSKFEAEEEEAADIEERLVEEVAPLNQNVDLKDHIQHIHESLNKIAIDQENNNKALEEAEQNFNNVANDQALDYVKVQNNIADVMSICKDLQKQVEELKTTEVLLICKDLQSQIENLSEEIKKRPSTVSAARTPKHIVCGRTY